MDLFLKMSISVGFKRPDKDNNENESCAKILQENITGLLVVELRTQSVGIHEEITLFRNTL